MNIVDKPRKFDLVLVRVHDHGKAPSGSREPSYLWACGFYLGKRGRYILLTQIKAQCGVTAKDELRLLRGAVDHLEILARPLRRRASG